MGLFCFEPYMTDIATLYSIFQNSSGVTTDSRNIKPGNIFWALKGENFDGNTFAIQAIQQGASAAIVDNPAISGENIYHVDDTLKALQSLATYHRKKFFIPLIGITGSNGKTTTKELINIVLQKKYFVLATIGNLNNHIGVPLTLLRLNTKHQVAIIEMGANHKDEIAELCEIALPTHGIITNIGKAHIGEFGGYENIIYAKTRLYNFIAKNRGTLFVNKDDKLLSQKAQEYPAEIIYFGTDANVDYPFELLSAEPYVTFSYRNTTMVESKLIGGYNFSNIMAAFAIGQYFGVDTIDGKNAIEQYLPQNNRSQIIDVGTNTIIMDAYNANPTSMSAALVTLSRMDFKNKVAILGDMFELGVYSDEEHTAIVQQARDSNIQTIVLVGTYFGKVNHEGCIHFDNYQQAKYWYQNQKFEQTAVLVKGSRSMKLEKILE